MAAKKPLLSTIQRLNDLVKRCNNNDIVNNQQRRRLHAEVSLLEMDIEDEIVDSGGNGACAEDRHQRLETLAGLGAQLGLHFVKRRGLLLRVLDVLDEVMRVLAVWLFLVDSAFLLAVPTVLLDLLSPRQTLSVLAKQFVGHSCLLLSAVTLTVNGLSPEDFAGACTLLCFSHASTMDAFILSAAVPVRHYTVVSR